MDNSAQSGSQDDAQVRSGQPVQQPVSQPTPAVGSVHKEASPVVQPEHHLQPAPHESTPAISQEVARHVEVSPDPEKLQLTNQQKTLGIKEAKESVPTPDALSDNVTYPMTKEEIVVSHKLSVSDPLRWLGALILRQWKSRHQKLQKE